MIASSLGWGTITPLEVISYDNFKYSGTQFILWSQFCAQIFWNAKDFGIGKRQRHEIINYCDQFEACANQKSCGPGLVCLNMPWRSVILQKSFLGSLPFGLLQHFVENHLMMALMAETGRD